ncbi:hypothetical protein BT69DRAFT_538771 [Atractiella rhizophila]|nr:hypothetical protein BT69DRAFT_538771 [Atractiella rhizophila]
MATYLPGLSTIHDDSSSFDPDPSNQTPRPNRTLGRNELTFGSHVESFDAEEYEAAQLEKRRNRAREKELGHGHMRKMSGAGGGKDLDVDMEEEGEDLLGERPPATKRNSAVMVSAPGDSSASTGDGVGTETETRATSVEDDSSYFLTKARQPRPSAPKEPESRERDRKEKEKEKENGRKKLPIHAQPQPSPPSNSLNVGEETSLSLRRLGSDLDRYREGEGDTELKELSEWKSGDGFELKKEGESFYSDGLKSASKEKAGKGKGKHKMTLREQENVIDSVKKENFNLKLKIFFLEDRLAKLAPDQIDAALKENIELKIEFQAARTEMKKYKRLLLEAEVARWKRDYGREKETRAHLEEQVREMRRGGRMSEGEVDEEVERLLVELDREREEREDLAAELEVARARLDEALERLEEEDAMSMSVEGRRKRAGSRLSDARWDGRSEAGGSAVSGSERRAGRGGDERREVARLERRLADLEQENASLRSQTIAQVTMLTSRNTEKEKLYDEIEVLKEEYGRLQTDFERVKRERDRERAGSRARSMIDDGGDGERSREEMEDDINAYRDKVAAMELRLEQKEKEIDDLMHDLDMRDQEHGDEVKRAEEDWKAEIDEARAAKEEMALVRLPLFCYIFFGCSMFARSGMGDRWWRIAKRRLRNLWRSLRNWTPSRRRMRIDWKNLLLNWRRHELSWLRRRRIWKRWRRKQLRSLKILRLWATKSNFLRMSWSRKIINSLSSTMSLTLPKRSWRTSRRSMNR